MIQMSTLFDTVRQALLGDTTVIQNDCIPIELNTQFNPDFSQVYITLFQQGCRPLRFGSRRKTLEASLQRACQKLKEQTRFSEFTIVNPQQCQLLFEMVTKEYPCSIRNLTCMRMNSPNRFEPGVNGLKYTYLGTTRYFMPTDGYTKSIMSTRQLLNHLSKQCGLAKKTNKISERYQLMCREPIEYTFIESIAYITYENEAIALERGIPLPENPSKPVILDRIVKSVDWLVNNMNEDGSFLYYYDAYRDSIVDDMHPNMTNPLYNNILRHSGGTISLLRGYELTGEERYLHKAYASLKFLLSTFRTHQYRGQYACFPFFNKKSKLGGAGIGLVALMHYYLHTRTPEFRREMDGLVRHMLSRIDAQGEMIGYFIHPQFNQGKPLIKVDDDTKKALFSFYYPGEALLGLALYYLHIPDIDPELKQEIREKSELALDFLVDIRPQKYADLFTALPADAWLMQAIEEWVKVEGMQKTSYIDFVFNDTQAMLERMYTEENTLPINKDYIGGFYYEYGDHAYHDASRCEGVVSAYYLAKYLGKEDKAQWIMEHMLLSAKGILRTFYDEKSVYCHIDQKKALHSFRFKLTRQWVRVDSVQHACCFYSRLYPQLQ